MAQLGEKHESKSTFPLWYQRAVRTDCIILLSLSALALAVYWATLRNYFLNSDFAHLMYTNIALNHPQLFVREFQQSWLGASDFELAYRPLPIFLLALNLMVAGANPLSFHLTSLTLHVACVWTVYFLVVELLSYFDELKPESERSAKKQFGGALLAAAIFSVFPITLEGITWIGAQPEVAAALFSLLSVFLLLKERSTKRVLYGVLSMVSFLMALLFHESALTVIAVPFLLSLFSSGNLKGKFSTALSLLGKPLAVCALYVLLRWSALGTVFGGYREAVKRLDNRDSIGYWFDPLFVERFFFPLAGSSGELAPLNLLVPVLYVAALVLNWPRLKSLCPPLVFCAIWFFIATLPWFRAGSLGEFLSNGRSFYLALVPCSLFLALLLVSPSPFSDWRSRLSTLVAALLVLVFAVVDVQNTFAWSEASRLTRVMRDQLVETIDKLPQDRQVILLNPPTSIGAMPGLNQALVSCSLEPPFSPSGFSNRLIVLDRNHFVEMDAYLLNASSLRQELLTGCLVTRWDEKRARLEEIQLIPDMMPLAAHNVSIVEEDSSDSDSRSFKLIVDPAISPLSCEAIEIGFQCEGTAKPAFASLTWRDNWPGAAQNVYDSDIHCGVDGDAKMHTYRFSVAERVGWYLKPYTDTLHLTIHNVRNINNLVARLATDAYYVPRLRPDMRYMVSSRLGFVPRQNEAVFLCDSEVPGTDKLIIELSRPNESFEIYSHTYRDTTVSDNALQRWEAAGASTCFRIPLSRLPAGYYNLRAAALGKNRRIVGAFGDPVVLRVSKD